MSPCTRTLLAATLAVAMSSRKGRLRRAGAAKAMGLVPITGMVPRVGTVLMLRVALVTMPTMPCLDASAA